MRSIQKLYLAFLHEQDSICSLKDFFQTVLTDDHCHSQLPVNPGNHLQEILGCQRIQHTGWLIQNQKFRIHSHNGCQIEHLLLSAGQFICFLMKPVLHAEEACHLADPASDRGGGKRHIFKAKSQFVPDKIRHNLIVRVLLDKSNLYRGLFRRHPVYIFVMEIYGSFSCSCRSQFRLYLPEKSRLSAAGFAADHQIFSFVYGKADLIQCPCPGIRISKA